ncbi:unnamed protein product [Victoria cruziana]
MDTTSGAGKHTNGPEDEGVNEAPTSAQKLTVREEDLRRASISSSSFGSSVDGDDCFQLEAGKLGKAATIIEGNVVQGVYRISVRQIYMLYRSVS